VPLLEFRTGRVLHKTLWVCILNTECNDKLRIVAIHAQSKKCWKSLLQLSTYNCFESYLWRSCLPVLPQSTFTVDVKILLLRFALKKILNFLSLTLKNRGPELFVGKWEQKNANWTVTHTSGEFVPVRNYV